MTPRSGSSPITAQATGLILNPWFDLPIVRSSWSEDGNRRQDITSPSRVDLTALGVELFFDHDEMLFSFSRDTTAARSLINPIRYFVTYRTFINYNVIGFAGALPENAADADPLRFKVQKIVRVEIDDPAGGAKLVHHEGEDATLELSVAALVDYLKVLNPTLYWAIAFYLIGCENRRYFLVEFYKAVEVIKNAFGSEAAFLDGLAPHGVTRAAFKAFGKVANDMRLAPLDIGRHAPAPGAPVYSVDLRHVLVEPRSRDVLESSTVLCRQVIDAYLEYLVRLGSEDNH